ncbi:hypothetical protein MTP99_019041 [Tenebrio molitor]|nr:hypothetical protein MTP99_019041 [Tenebrio molitor]
MAAANNSDYVATSTCQLPFPSTQRINRQKRRYGTTPQHKFISPPLPTPTYGAPHATLAGQIRLENRTDSRSRFAMTAVRTERSVHQSNRFNGNATFCNVISRK